MQADEGCGHFSGPIRQDGTSKHKISDPTRIAYGQGATLEDIAHLPEPVEEPEYKGHYLPVEIAEVRRFFKGHKDVRFDPQQMNLRYIAGRVSEEGKTFIIMGGIKRDLKLSGIGSVYGTEVPLEEIACYRTIAKFEP